VAAALRAIEVIMGRAPMPDRSEVDAWIATIDAIRDTVYRRQLTHKRRGGRLACRVQSPMVQVQCLFSLRSS
jgi:hypothetical protein